MLIKLLNYLKDTADEVLALEPKQFAGIWMRHVQFYKEMKSHKGAMEQ